MGGPVTLGLRRQGGQVLGYDGYTSEIDWMCDPLFFEEKSPLYQDMLQNNAPVAPHGYGLVFVDHQTKWIGSMQSYNHPGYTFSASLALSVAGSYTGGLQVNLPHERFRRIFEAWPVYIHALKIKTSRKTARRSLQESHLDLDDYLQSLSSYEQKSYTWMDKATSRTIEFMEMFETLPPGWTVERFDENLEGSWLLFQALMKRKIPLDPAPWIHHFQERWESYEENLEDQKEDLEENEGGKENQEELAFNPGVPFTSFEAFQCLNPSRVNFFPCLEIADGGCSKRKS